MIGPELARRNAPPDQARCSNATCSARSGELLPLVSTAGEICTATANAPLPRHHAHNRFSSMLRSLSALTLVICLSVISLLTACSNDGIALLNPSVDREAGLVELGTMDQAPNMDQESLNFDRL